MKKLKVVYLDISSWRGISIGASHWYGKLVCGKERIELYRVLTAVGAREMNRRWGRETFEKDDTCKSFESERDIINLARATFKKHFKGASVLILGSPVYADPQKVLIGPRDFKQKVNAWYRRAKKIGGYDRGHDNEMGMIADDFWAYFRDRTGD